MKRMKIRRRKPEYFQSSNKLRKNTEILHERAKRTYSFYVRNIYRKKRVPSEKIQIAWIQRQLKKYANII